LIYCYFYLCLIDQAESSRLGDIEIENEALMSRIATAMVNPSQIDCHNDYAKRPRLDHSTATARSQPTQTLRADLKSFL